MDEDKFQFMDEADDVGHGSDAAPDIAPPRFKISINDKIVDKTVDDVSWYTNGWRNVALTQPEFQRVIANGNAYCAQLSGPRRTKNFVETNVASVDIDHGMTLAEAILHPLVAGHALFLYTTHSHTAEENRFRVVFVLPRSITVANEMRAITRALALRLEGDPAATDATRIFFGNRNAEFTNIGRAISEPLLNDLLLQGDAVAAAYQSKSSQHSLVALPADELVRLADGRTMALDALGDRARIYCPFHADGRASAFLVRSQRGTAGIHCSTCAQTYWPAGAEQYPFDDFERAVRAAAQAEDSVEKLRGTTISIVTGQPTPRVLGPGLTFIKSYKGSGKTEGVAKLALREAKVLVVSHRQLLNRQIAKRLGLTSYLDRDVTEFGGTLSEIFAEEEGARPWSRRAQPWKGAKDRRLHRFAVSVDGLTKLVPANMDYDLIVLDESEQVLAHFLSSTLDGTGVATRDALFTHLTHLIRRAKKIVALDADLGWITFQTLSRMREPATEEAPDLPAKLVWMNEGQPGKGKTIQLFESERALIADLMNSVATGKKCLVASTSKKRVNRLAAAIQASVPEARWLVVTSDTSHEPEVRRFINDAATRMVAYDVVFASPSLGTGVDITFPNRAQLVDVVYGFCDPDVVTHFDFDQQLARVRDPKEVKVWITPRQASYETNLDVVRHDIRSQSQYRNVVLGYDDDGEDRYREDDPFIEMAALINRQRRASLNSLRQNFIRYKEAEGFLIATVGKDSDGASDGSEILRLGRELDDERYAAQMLSAGVLERFRFERVKVDIENEGIVGEEEKWAYNRTSLERFYRQKATRELIELDDRGRFRSRVALFREIWDELHAPNAYAAPFAPERARNVATPAIKQQVLADLLRSTPLFPGGVLDREREIESDDLVAFARAVVEQKVVIETQFGKSVRRDVQRKPVQQLNEFLTLIGLKLVKSRGVKQAGAVTRFYRIDPVKLDQMIEFRRLRSETGGWEALDLLYGRSKIYQPDDDSRLDWLPKPKAASTALVVRKEFDLVRYEPHAHQDEIARGRREVAEWERLAYTVS